MMLKPIALSGLLAFFFININPLPAQNIVYEKKPVITGEEAEPSELLRLGKAGRNPDGAAGRSIPASQKALKRALVKNLRRSADRPNAAKVFVPGQGGDMPAKISGTMRLLYRDEKVPPASDKQDKPGKVQGWGRNHAVSNYQDDQQRPSMTKDSQGRLYLAYDWIYSGTGKYEIWLARSTDGGNNWEDLTYLGDDNYNYFRPSLAASANDELFLVYQTDDTLGMQYVWSSGGDKWNFDYLISWKAEYPKCHWPRVAAGRKSDSTRVVVTWQYDYYGNGSDYDIGYAYSRDGGINWLGRLNHIANTVNQEMFPAVAVSDSLSAIAYDLKFTTASADSDSIDIMYARTSGLSFPIDTFAWNSGGYGIATSHHDRFPDLSASGKFLYLAGQRAYYKQTDYDILVRSSKDGGKTFAGPAVYASGTTAEERYPALWAQDTTCWLAYSHDSSWTYVRWSVDTGKTFNAAQIASDSSTCVGGQKGIALSLLSENPRVAWADNRNVSWGLGFDVYFNTNLKNFPRECDLAPYKPESWEFPLVPSRLRGTSVVSDTLPGLLTAAKDTTFMDFCVIDSTSVDVADTFRVGLYVDEWLYAYLEDFRLPAWWTETVADYPMWVFGGRHTLRLYADYEERILYENTRDNNIFAQQWVWTPYRLPDDTTLQVPTPPVNVTDPANPDYNCDGYTQATTNYWSAVGLKPAAGADYKLRVYGDPYGKAESGFTTVITESDLGWDSVEVIAVNGNALTPGTKIYPGVYRTEKSGDGDYYLQFCLQDGTIPSSGWSTVKTMGEYQVVHTYDVSLSQGINYYAACSLAAGPASLGFAVFSPSGSEYKPRSQAVGQLDGLTLPGQQFLFTADTTGWFSLVVWHNAPAKDDTARYFVGLNTTGFGLPLAVELSYFTAQVCTDSITLKWRAETGMNVYRWLIERSTAPEGGYQLVGIIAARENTGMPSDYSWTDRGLTGGQKYYYRLGRQETDGKVLYFGPVSATARIDTFSTLMEVSPNPFRQRVSIVYQVAEPNTVVSLGVYNIAGQLVKGIQQEILPPGRYSWLWDGCNGRGSRVPAGCYLVKAEIGKHRILSKIVRLP
jgi:hypothetical protein